MERTGKVLAGVGYCLIVPFVLPWVVKKDIEEHECYPMFVDTQQVPQSKLGIGTVICRSMGFILNVIAMFILTLIGLIALPISCALQLRSVRG